MVFRHQLSLKETATALNIDYPNVRQRFVRAQRKYIKERDEIFLYLIARQWLKYPRQTDICPVCPGCTCVLRWMAWAVEAISPRPCWHLDNDKGEQIIHVLPITGNLKKGPGNLYLFSQTTCGCENPGGHAWQVMPRVYKTQVGMCLTINKGKFSTQRLITPLPDLNTALEIAEGYDHTTLVLTSIPSSWLRRALGNLGVS